MDSGKRLLIFTVVLVVGALLALIEAQRRASSPSSRLASIASVGAPVAPTLKLTTTVQAPPAAPTPAARFPTTSSAPVVAPPAAAPPPPVVDTTNPDGDLKSSQERLNAIDQLALNSDRLFATPDLPQDFGSWSVNPQGMDQLDYQTPDGNITQWMSTNADGSRSVRAQEAQLASGELVDRWLNDDGRVEQIMHQYDRNNSYSVYYYPTGEVEATRIVRNGSEIFTKYDRDGRQLQRTSTPAGD